MILQTQILPSRTVAISIVPANISPTVASADAFTTCRQFHEMRARHEVGGSLPGQRAARIPALDVPGAMGPGLALAARHIMCIRHAGPSSSLEPLLSRSRVPAAQSRMIASHGVGDFLHTYNVAPSQVDLDSMPRITCYCARTYLGYVDTSRTVPTHLPSTVLHPFRQPRNDKWNKDKSKQTDTHQDAPTACNIQCKLRYQRTIHPQWLRGVILPLFLYSLRIMCAHTQAKHAELPTCIWLLAIGASSFSPSPDSGAPFHLPP